MRATASAISSVSKSLYCLSIACGMTNSSMRATSSTRRLFAHFIVARSGFVRKHTATTMHTMTDAATIQNAGFL